MGPHNAALDSAVYDWCPFSSFCKQALDFQNTAAAAEQRVETTQTQLQREIQLLYVDNGVSAAPCVWRATKKQSSVYCGRSRASFFLSFFLSVKNITKRSVRTVGNG